MALTPACDARLLVEESFCLRSLLRGNQQILGAILYVLCKQANMNCTPQDLQAIARPINQIMSEDQILASILYILCANQGLAAGQIRNYVNDPNAEGIKPQDLTAPAVAYPFGGGTEFQWDIPTQQWV